MYELVSSRSCESAYSSVVRVLRPMSSIKTTMPLSRRTLVKGLLLASAAPMLAACQSDFLPKHEQPLPASLQVKMERLGMSESDPIYMRIFKEEAQLEIWKRGPQGKYLLLESYDICTWSGELGPKFQEGDRQAPEGFYTITPAQMNPNSSFYLSFNLGFPNSYDRAHGRTGSHLMVHGACSSAGCYAMTDEQISEIYAFAREAFQGGQRAFQVDAFPFRMTPQNMARYAGHRYFPFWQMLQEGYQHFEVTQLPPKVDVCDRRYIFNAVAADQFSAAQQCPSYELSPQVANAFNAAQSQYQAEFQVAVANLYPGGVPDTLANQRVMFAGVVESGGSSLPSTATPAAPAVRAPVAVASAPAPAPAATAASLPVAPPPLLESVAATPAPVPVIEPLAVSPAPTVELVTTQPAVPLPAEQVAAESVAAETVAAAPAEPAQPSGFAQRAGSLFDDMFQRN